MGVKTLVRRLPGVVSGVRLGKRMVAIARRGKMGAYAGAPNGEHGLGILALPDSRHRFVGYYDHSPFKPDDERLLLVHSTRHPAWRRPSAAVPVCIELINHQDSTVVCELGESYAWNWQQGARALWLNAETIIFNVYDSAMDRYRARMVRCDGTHLADLTIPVQEIDSQGRIYGLSYEALAAVRPDYGYRNRQPGSHELAGNAIEQFDPSTHMHNVLIRLSTLQKQAQTRHGSPIMQAKLNHVMASPNAARLVFLFRYFVGGRRITDLYEMSTNGGPARLLVADSGVSHVCWWGDDKVIATMMGVGGFGYYVVPIDAAEPTLMWAQQDGHPSCVDERYLLTDTYPDRYALRRLLMRSVDTGGLTELGAFPEPLFYQGETRCDLHPSLSPSGRYIQVDCAIGHRRSVAILANPLFGGGGA
ncbi:hypothetical protein [Pseudomonas sp. MYb185]|uniref:hypothetical protein n=1 Tax=Pseudomonas sp. MYb185 TaxID=1848729 RepID=UPI000CFDF973|nr:hypothetical protein [Pseudomonas sp. MYb185]PRB75440.1 hypothetical protein CQ007_17940 [Pseudomonas sp. MYb185]